MFDSIRTIPVRVRPPYDVRIGSGLLGRCGDYLAALLGQRRIAVLADDTVASLYLDTVTAALEDAGFAVCSHIFPSGEGRKNLSTLTELLEFLASEHLTRTDCVAALGGGVTGDMAGFAAAVYLRGIRYVQLPPPHFLLPLFHILCQPASVSCYTDCLKTLPPDVCADGAAEAVKTGVLSDEALFALFEDGTLTADPGEVIARCVAYKAGVVERDEKEQGERKLLNLGHTVGHAIEKCSGYVIPHGHAVAAGLAVIARAAEALGWTEESLAARITACLSKNGLPTGTDYSAEALAEAALSDKKRAGGDITLVVPRKIGHCELRKVPVADLLPIIRAGLEA